MHVSVCYITTKRTGVYSSWKTVKVAAATAKWEGRVGKGQNRETLSLEERLWWKWMQQKKEEKGEQNSKVRG